MSLSHCFSFTPANSSLCLADVEKGREKQSKRASPFGAEQLCNRFAPCPRGTTHRAGHPAPPAPRLSAHKGRGLPRDPVAVEELQGASPTQELTAHGGLPNLPSSSCASLCASALQTNLCHVRRSPGSHVWLRRSLLPSAQLE